MYQRADPEIFLGGGGSKGNILLEVNLKKFAFSGGGGGGVGWVSQTP